MNLTDEEFALLEFAIEDWYGLVEFGPEFLARLGADVGGIAVHIAARVAARAGADEVMVSSTVKDLVAGSGIEFEDKGSHALKGVPEEWRLFLARR